MKICSDCFSDKEIITRIESHKIKGKCDCCKKNNKYIYDTNKNTYLNGIFDRIIDLYKPAKYLPDTKKTLTQTFIKDELANVWQIFNNVKTKEIQKILIELSKETYELDRSVFDEAVVSIRDINSKDNKQYLILENNDWDKFVKDLKFKNRFCNKGFNKEIFEDILSYKCINYKKGAIFYRGRKSNNKELNEKDLKAPPIELTVEGRANSKGIRRLYLSTNKETVVKELKPTINDNIYIGKFELTEDITVVDLKDLELFSPFVDDEIIKKYFLNIDTLRNIKRDMERISLSDSDGLEYIPTQFISDLICAFEKKKRSGISYKSTVSDKGYNVVLFNPNLCKCTDVEKHIITELSYK